MYSTNNKFMLLYIIETSSSNNDPVARDAFPVFERTTDDDAAGEEENGSENAASAKVILDIASTVGTSISAKNQEYLV